MSKFNFAFESLLKYKKEEKDQIISDIRIKTNEIKILETENISRQKNSIEIFNSTKHDSHLNYTIAKNYKIKNLEIIQENTQGIADQQDEVDKLQKKLFEKENEIKAIEKLKEKKYMEIKQKEIKKKQAFLDDRYLALKSNSKG